MAARRKRGRRRRAGPAAAGQTVYVETSVWGMTPEDQPAALRQPTLQFLRQCAAGRFVAYISTVVIDEANAAPVDTAARILREIQKLAPRVLEPGDEAETLAQAYLDEGVIPLNKRDDARHVAVATVAGLQILVSWNHRHLVNERKRTLFNAVNRLAGYEQVLAIHTPFEVIA